MHGFGQVVNLFVMDLPVNVFVGVNFFLAVRNNVGDDNLVIYHKAHVPGKNLVAVLH